jgi:hypothetical protein
VRLVCYAVEEKEDAAAAAAARFPVIQNFALSNALVFEYPVHRGTKRMCIAAVPFTIRANHLINDYYFQIKIGGTHCVFAFWFVKPRSS